MDKPSWGNGPSWAEYLAKDDDGTWYWYEFQPVFSKETGTWNSSQGRWTSHSTHLIESRTDNGTLESRP